MPVYYPSSKVAYIHWSKHDAEVLNLALMHFTRHRIIKDLKSIGIQCSRGHLYKILDGDALTVQPQVIEAICSLYDIRLLDIFQENSVLIQNRG